MLLSFVGISCRNSISTRTRRSNIVVSVVGAHDRQYHQHPHPHHGHVPLVPWALVGRPPPYGYSLKLRREFRNCSIANMTPNVDDPGTNSRRRRKGIIIPPTPNNFSVQNLLFHSTTTTSSEIESQSSKDDDEDTSTVTSTNDNDTVPVVSDDEEEYSDLVMEEYENSASAVAAVQTINNMKQHHHFDASSSNNIKEDHSTANTQQINNSERHKRKLLLQERKKQQAQRLWRSPEEEVRGETLDDGTSSTTAKRRQETSNNIQTAWTKAVIDRPTSSNKKQYFHDPCPVSNNNKDGSSSSENVRKVVSRSSSTTDMDDYYRGGWNEKQIIDPDHATNIDREHDSGSTSYSNRLQDIIQQISIEEQKGGRQRERQLGVLREDPQEDMRALMYNYTVPALASALRDREDTLQYCATLLSEGRMNDLQRILQPFESQYVKLRRYRNKHLSLDNGIGFDYVALEMLRKGLARMSRQISQAHQKRAGVVLPLCNVNGIACVLFEKRSRELRAHPNEVCLPGGMVSVGDDKSIVVTCLREMEEEIGLRANNVQVLGILRCNWGEIAKLTGVAVTPVVGFVGELGNTSSTDNNNDSSSSDHNGHHSYSSSSSSLSPNDEIIRHGSTTNTIESSAVQEESVRLYDFNKQQTFDPNPQKMADTTTTNNRLVLNYDEVSECFTVPIETLLDKSQWIHRDDCAPIFVGGPYVIWGLTGYIVDRFVKDILGRYTVST